MSKIGDEYHLKLLLKDQTAILASERKYSETPCASKNEQTTCHPGPQSVECALPQGQICSNKHMPHNYDHLATEEKSPSTPTST